MTALEYVGLIALGVVILALASVGYGAMWNSMRPPQKRGLFSRLALGNSFTGLKELWRQHGVDGFLFGERRH